MNVLLVLKRLVHLYYIGMVYKLYSINLALQMLKLAGDLQLRNRLNRDSVVLLGINAARLAHDAEVAVADYLSELVVVLHTWVKPTCEAGLGVDVGLVD